jgi:hypothetical protein
MIGYVIMVVLGWLLKWGIDKWWKKETTEMDAVDIPTSSSFFYAVTIK